MKEGDLVPGGIIRQADAGTLYVEPLNMRPLFPEEKVSMRDNPAVRKDISPHSRKRLSSKRALKKAKV